MFGDGSYLGTKKVNDNKVITDYGVKNLDIGLNYTWHIQTMPLELELTDGTFLGNKHRLTKATLQLLNTNGFNINGQQVDFRFYDQNILDTQPPKVTGTKTIRFIGWHGGNLNKASDINIAGNAYQQATILSITTEAVQ